MGPTQVRRLQIAGIAALALIAVAVIGVSWWVLRSATPTAAVGSSHGISRTVVYEAEGSGARTASITLQTDAGGTSQQTGVTLPLTTAATKATGLTFRGFKPGDFVYLSVQNSNAAGTVTCRITVDGTVVSENTSSGGYTIATCQATVR